MLLGRTAERKNIHIPEKDRATHMQIIGSTGEGKSKFMEHMIREDIIENRGLCLIDPHGYLYHDIVSWAETFGMLDGRRPKKIILFDPSETKWAFGFNPLKITSGYLSYHVDAMVRATAKVWGGEDSDKTPRLKRCLRLLFHALAEKNLSLTEARYLLDARDKTVREYLTRDLEDVIIRQEWDYFNTTTPKVFFEQFESTINRMMEFLASPIISHTIGQLEQSLNLREIMDEGHILLVNLASTDKISEDNARLLGTLLVNDLFMRAKGRAKNSRPFYLYIDECARYINEDIGRILDEGRKFGLHLILAHQHLAQLKKAGEDIYQSVMTDAKTKVIFGGLSAEDARVLAEQVFLGNLDLEEAKESLSKPVVVRYIKTWLENYSHGRSSSRGESTSKSRGTGSGESWADGEAVRLSQDFFGEGQTTQTSTRGGSSSSFESEGEGKFSSEGESESRGGSEAYLPELEERPTTVFSLEEQIYKAMDVMVNLPTQHAIIKLSKKNPQIVKAPFVKEGLAGEERVNRFKAKCFTKSKFIKPYSEATLEIKNRQELIEGRARQKQEPQEPESFIESE